MKVDEILRFWFGHLPGRSLDYRGTLQIARRLPMWAGNWGRWFLDTDTGIRRRFEDDLRRAAQGEYDDWASSPAGRLALILLLDQFSRNMYRGTPQAYAYDAKTLPIALEGLDRQEDKLVYPAARSFFYLPLVHQEDLACQERAVALYREALREARGIQRAILLAENISAVRHRDAIRRFGRFPHRNEVLGRTSAAAELRFLRQPFSRF
jgi:uncharacterized protein (DUF924 family)